MENCCAFLSSLRKRALRCNKDKAVKYPYFPTIMHITRSVAENYGRFDIFIPTIIPT